MQKPKNQEGIPDVTDLLCRIRGNDPTAFDTLCEVYRPLLTAMVTSAHERYRSYGSEREDLSQEASLALYKAAVSYRMDQEDVTFGLYAKICVRNRMISCGRMLIRHTKASQASRNMTHSDSERVPNRGRHLPEEYLEKLSAYEQVIYRYYAEGRSYREIAGLVNRPEKSVENAIYRIRTKIRRSDGHMPE
ncbi:MAG: sigma-70 family RNA polymerase sigma factor [Eubacteriales bacterium]